uniref:C-type lectin domain-containing protein n=1 Tax=Sinocyclocheilus anshuiensis TaxID=1608454 RepID=A0A671L6S7_9TELE
MLICTFRFWVSGEPNGYSKENCVVTYPSSWNDLLCNYVLKWICEKTFFKLFYYIYHTNVF